MSNVSIELNSDAFEQAVDEGADILQRTIAAPGAPYDILRDVAREMLVAMRQREVAACICATA